MLNAIREARDYAYMAATLLKHETSVEGIKLSLRQASPRMRYVMCRGYEIGDAHLAKLALTAEDSVLEAGTAIGFMALYCIKRIGVRNYWMVEANPALEQSIRENFALNDIAMPTLRIGAITGSDGPVRFGVNRNFWSSSTVKRQGEHRITVEGRSIPSMLAEMPFNPTTLIMDIEGGEASIPHDHFLHFQKIIIETHPKLVGDSPIDALLSFLRASGFQQVGKEGGSYAFHRVA
jgi:FkbM family methyltransferase